MKHSSFDDLQRVATITPASAPSMSRRERLERWAELLERHPERLLTPLQRLEFLPSSERLAFRADNSPLSVAFEDPLLRQHGLASDRFGDAARFFELPTQQAHYLLCDCHYQRAVTAAQVASRIRSIATRVTFAELWNRMRSASLARFWA
ncbi:MAG: hypothetical protein JWL84_2220 [Rhodospirillales bacterium]|jgi:hypothetical protein|nr:hypothetical protein [Rhodospirillales bacterium]